MVEHQLVSVTVLMRHSNLATIIMVIYMHMLRISYAVILMYVQLMITIKAELISLKEKSSQRVGETIKTFQTFVK